MTGFTIYRATYLKVSIQLYNDETCLQYLYIEKSLKFGGN